MSDAIRKRARLVSYCRVLLVFIACSLVCTVWFFYDGFIGYPEEQRRFEQYQQIMEEHGREGERVWRKLARDKGWSLTELPEERGGTDFLAQKILGTICFLMTMMFLAAALIINNRMKQIPGTFPDDWAD